MFEEGAGHTILDHRFHALHGLTQLKSPHIGKPLRDSFKMIAANRREGEEWPWELSRFLYLVTNTDDRECWSAFSSICKQLQEWQRIGLIRYVGYEKVKNDHPVRREQLRFLQSFLDDRSPVDDGPGKKCEVRDVAEHLLAEQLGVKTRLHPKGGWMPHPDRGPLSRLLFREVLRELASRELAKAGK